MTVSSTTPPPAEDAHRVFTAPEGDPVVQSPSTSDRRPRRRLGGIAPVSLLLALAAVVAIAGVAFAVGRTTAGSAAAGTAGSNGVGDANGGNAFPGGIGDDQNGTAPQFGAPGAAGDDDANRSGDAHAITGTVTSVSGDSLTVELANGQSIQVSIGPGTTYHSQANASQSDLATGDTVIISVNGGFRPGDDSSGVTASDVTIAGS